MNDNTYFQSIITALDVRFCPPFANQKILTALRSNKISCSDLDGDAIESALINLSSKDITIHIESPARFSCCSNNEGITSIISFDTDIDTIVGLFGYWIECFYQQYLEDEWDRSERRRKQDFMDKLSTDIIRRSSTK